MPEQNGLGEGRRTTPVPSAEQRWLERALRVGGVLVVVGLVMTVVIVSLYFAGEATPDTWAYGVAMLAPVGFGLILVSLVGVAVRRRRASMPSRATGPGAS
jgi:hypothetical protein